MRRFQNTIAKLSTLSTTTTSKITALYTARISPHIMDIQSRFYSQSGSFKKKERAVENQYANQHDKKLLEKLKEKLFGIINRKESGTLNSENKVTDSNVNGKQ